VKVAAGSKVTTYYTQSQDDALSANSPVQYDDQWAPMLQTWTRRLFRG
jgi:hypothetical protein